MASLKEEGINYGYKKLADAIVLQAIEDYREAGNTRKGRKIKLSVAKFFYSPLFGMITDISPDELIKHLQELDSRPINILDDWREIA